MKTTDFFFFILGLKLPQKLGAGWSQRKETASISIHDQDVTAALHPSEMSDMHFSFKAACGRIQRDEHFLQSTSITYAISWVMVDEKFTAQTHTQTKMDGDGKEVCSVFHCVCVPLHHIFHHWQEGSMFHGVLRPPCLCFTVSIFQG